MHNDIRYNPTLPRSPLAPTVPSIGRADLDLEIIDTTKGITTYRVTVGTRYLGAVDHDTSRATDDRPFEWFTLGCKISGCERTLSDALDMLLQWSR